MKKIFKKREIALSEILILIIALFATSYLIAETNEIRVVSASTPSRMLCCPETKDGAICQDLADNVFDEQCTVPSSQVFTSCDETANCKIGCCIDEVEGTCSEQSPVQKCTSDGGRWEDDETCNSISDCRNVCCILGEETYFVTETRCERMSNLLGKAKEIQQTNELQCLLLSATQEIGACIIASASGTENRCKRATESECFEMGGDFENGLLCSNPALNTSCEKTSEKTCVEGKDEVYFLDSCGNLGNIYDSSKEDDDDYWSRIYTKAESCGADSRDGNANSNSCGNCNFHSGSTCGLTNSGEPICKDLNCKDSKGNDRRNGESWCVYESNIGEEDRQTSVGQSNFASDAVGSRHWKEYCIDGEVKVEACSDYRNQICIEDEIGISNIDETMSVATCKVNRGLSCFNYNTEEDTEERIRLCQENYDCMIKRVNVDSGFKFDFCTPRYPTGFDLSTERGETSSTQICGMANQKCTVVEKKRLSGGWRCIENCDCKDKEFVEKMNDLCISMGDCGSYVNYVGEGTDNIRVTYNNDRKPLEISWKDYVNLARIVPGKKATIENITTFLESLGEFSYGAVEEEEEEEQGGGMLGGLTSGPAGIGMAMGMAGYALSTLPAAAPTFGGISAASLTGYEGMAIAANNPLTPSTFGSFANGLMAVGIGVTVGSLIGNLFGLEGESSMIMAVAGGIAGIGYLIWQHGVLSFSWTPFIFAVIALVLVAVILKALGIGKTRTRIVEFECLPWTAPVGGNDCDKCNEDPNKPCSKYKCQSLGAACELINEDIENPTCFDPNPNDNSPPVISTSDIQEGYKFQNEQTMKVEIRKENGECIEEFTPVSFTLQTDEYAQCKFEMQETSDYEEMQNYPLEKTLYTKNHSFVMMMPSLEALEVYGVTGNLIEMLGNMDMYVRCQDTHGNYNSEEYEINFCLKSGPDETPPKVVATTPKNNAFTEFEKTEILSMFYLNEPGNCKWSSTDKSYNEMENEMTCFTDLEEVKEMGWLCQTSLTGLVSGENNFYVRCADKPWVSEEEQSERNVNQESYNYKLISSSSGLKINSLSPSGEFVFGLEPIPIELKAVTSGGAESGKATCYYNFVDYSKANQFMETFSTNHKQDFSQMLRGEKTAYVLCEDVAGNQARNSTTFDLKIDTSAPIVVRIYDEGNLKIITNEDAECYYSFESCSFNFEDGIKMTTGFSREHVADLIYGQTYHIRCKDIFGNFGIGCTRVSSSSLN